VSLEERINKAMLNFLKRLDIDAEEVTSYDEDKEWSGGCETCAFEETVVYIYYRDGAGNS
jgi:hypothetical protein